MSLDFQLVLLPAQHSKEGRRAIVIAPLSSAQIDDLSDSFDIQNIKGSRGRALPYYSASSHGPAVEDAGTGFAGADSEQAEDTPALSPQSPEAHTMSSPLTSSLPAARHAEGTQGM